MGAGRLQAKENLARYLTRLPRVRSRQQQSLSKPTSRASSSLALAPSPRPPATPKAPQLTLDHLASPILLRLRLSRSCGTDSSLLLSEEGSWECFGVAVLGVDLGGQAEFGAVVVRALVSLLLGSDQGQVNERAVRVVGV